MYIKVGQVADCPTFDQEIYWNPPGWGSVKVDLPGWDLAMLMGIKPGGYIPFHTDHPAEENGLSGKVLQRYHLILRTNSKCWNFHAGDWQQLEVGGVYQMDPTKEHASINLGDTVRVHLVVDGDEWQLDRRF